MLYICKLSNKFDLNQAIHVSHNLIQKYGARGHPCKGKQICLNNNVVIKKIVNCSNLSAVLKIHSYL